MRVGDRVRVCAGEGLPRLPYAWGRLHAVIVCVCGVVVCAPIAVLCVRTVSGEVAWVSGRAHVAVTVSTVTVTVTDNLWLESGSLVRVSVIHYSLYLY